VAACAHRLGRPLRLVGCLTPEELQRPLPPGLINLPCIYAVTPKFYDAHTLRVPSLLRAVDQIAALHPDRIVISTPGPVGLVGLAAARLLGVPCVGVYHTDFARQAEAITGDPQMASLVEAYTHWFFARMDELRVPSHAYMNMLADHGMDRRRMKLFRRHLDGGFASVDPTTLDAVRNRWFADGQPTLLYAGRLGQEKNLDFLLSVVAALQASDPDVRLLLAGDGPARQALTAAAAGHANVIFTGRLEQPELRACYALADAFVFPSTTDTFGMVVLEAQAFGLPAVVADAGGPPEIITHGRTGYALPTDDREIWVQTLRRLVDARRANPADYARWRDEIRADSHSIHNWETLLDDLMGPRPAQATPDASGATAKDPGVLALPV
jgi:glycosyltransferase involved in cell wall biosynthesis